MWRIAPALLAVVACRPAPARVLDPTPIAIAGHRAAPPPVEPEPAQPPAKRLGPLHRAAAFLFQPSPDAATATTVRSKLRLVAATATGERVEVGCKRGTTLVDREGREHALALRPDAVVIAPDGAAIAARSGGRVAVLALPQGRALGTWDGEDPTWLADGTLALRHGCAWVAIAPQQPDTPAQSLGEHCGAPLLSEPGTARLWFAVSDAQPRADDDARAPTRALLGLSPGQTALEQPLGGDVPMFAPRLSHDGSIVCATTQRRGHALLQCRLRDGGVFEPVAQDVVGQPVFADDAPRLLVTVGDRETGQRDLHVVDFALKIVRRLGHVAHHRFAFLPGAERVVAYDGARGLVFELDTGLVSPFGDEHDDWVAVVPDAAGGSGDSFLATRLGRPCAELVRVQLPRRE
ncbi:MAG: hypothetical protein K1X88_34360 [Nannocystaceae bacterium]|nr:hypothetical protein [Nannocystaceae bacterium]